MNVCKLFILVSSMALTACGSVIGENEPNWIPYKDIDQTTKFVSFTQITTAYEMQNKDKQNKTETVGRAFVKTSQNASGDKFIGYMFDLFDKDNQPMATIFLADKLGYLNPHLQEHMSKLAKTKKFEFYEFGKGHVSHVEFSAKNGICLDFRGKNGVNVKMATNYYLDDARNNYYTSIITADLTHSEIKNMNYVPIFTGSNQSLLAKHSEKERENGSKLAKMNIHEKATILTNIVCK